jgi:AcrR family transcriptional regulator
MAVIKKSSHKNASRSRHLIKQAFGELLHEKDLAKITVTDIVERANISRGTFYAHYADVYDLLSQIEAEMETEFYAALEPVLSSADNLTPPKATAKVFRCLEANADLCRATLGPHGDREFSARVIETGRKRCEESCKKHFPNASDRQIETYFTFITGGCIALMERWLKEDMAESSAVLADAAEQIMENGLGFLQ